MNSPTQLHLIYKIEAMRQVILQTADLSAVLQMAQRVYVIASPVPIDPEFGYKIEGKDRILQMLSNEIRTFERGNAEIEVVQFQIASTILMLMLQFIEGSLEEIQQVLHVEVKTKVA